MPVTRKTVVVRDLAIQLSIGVHDHEKLAPQRLLVSVEADLAVKDDEHDAVSATLDYDVICDFVRALAREPHVELQETVARRILSFILSLPSVEAARVSTRKPDVFDDCRYVGVVLEGCNR